MQATVGQILEGTFVLTLVYLIVTNADNFSKVVSSISSAYVGSVKVLQGR